jgi:hypothetical protein
VNPLNFNGSTALKKTMFFAGLFAYIVLGGLWTSERKLPLGANWGMAVFD